MKDNTTLFNRIMRRLCYEVREMLRFGRLVKPDVELTKRTLKPDASFKVALVAIARDEDNYIKEWADYHLTLGFDEIFVYQNEWRCTALPESSKLHFIPYDGDQRQLSAYNDFLHDKSSPFDFAAFIDVDEFIVSDRFSTIQDICRQYVGYEAIGLNWRVFGDSGLEKVEDGDYSCLKRFIRCAKEFDHHVKTIVNLHSDVHGLSFGDPHSVWRGRNVSLAVTSDRRHRTYAAFNEFSIEPDVWINHYAVKTKQEFVENKCRRGRADTPRASNNQFRNLGYFDHYNRNDVENLVAYDFAVSRGIFDTRESVPR